MKKRDHDYDSIERSSAYPVMNELDSLLRYLVPPYTI